MAGDFYGLRSIALGRPIYFHLRAALMVAGCALALSGCLPGGGMLVGEKATRPLSNEMVETIERNGMAKEKIGRAHV